MRHRSLRGLLLTLALALLGACSGGDVILNVDIASFLADDDLLYDYALPLLPVPVRVDGLPVVPTLEVNLAEGVGDVIVPKRGTLFLDLEARNRKGRAEAMLRLRLGATEAEVQLPSSVLDSFALTLGPDSTSTVSQAWALGPRELDLFRGTKFYLGIDGTMDLPAGAVGDSLAGQLEITGLRARIVSDEDFF